MAVGVKASQGLADVSERAIRERFGKGSERAAAAALPKGSVRLTCAPQGVVAVAEVSLSDARLAGQAAVVGFGGIGTDLRSKPGGAPIKAPGGEVEPRRSVRERGRDGIEEVAQGAELAGSVSMAGSAS